MWVEYDADAIRQRIKALGISPNDVSKRSKGKVSRITVSRLMRGQMDTCQRDKVEALARALMIPAEQLIKG